jgi:DNA-binding response OmpR family regulator
MLMKATLLVIERKRRDSPSFVAGLQKKGYQVETVPTGNVALRVLDEVDPDVVVVNAATLRTNGTRICKALQDNMDGVPIVLINDEEHTAPKNVSANVVLKLPFTIRKLDNRIVSLLPGEGSKLLYAGPIRLDLERKFVRCLGKKERLTPRLTQLLKVFMEHPGEVLERKSLFSQVWNTDYTEDTRTLDVHISWLRKALEPDPRKPQFIKTLRGVGYRLDVEGKFV